MLAFAQRLREAGLAVSTDRALTMLAASAEVDLLDRAQVAAATRAASCGSPTDVLVHDRVFAQFFAAAGVGHDTSWEVERAAPREGDQGGPGEPGAPREVAHDLAVRRTPQVGVDAERGERARVLVDSLAAPPRRRARRPRPGGHRWNMPATARSMMRHGGEPVRPVRRRPARRPRRVVAVLDVSGSMRPWVEDHLLFAYALRQAWDAEVFTLSTRLTRVSGQLARPRVDDAVAGLGDVVDDWTGGTRLAEGLASLVFDWGRRGPLRGAVVLICSDGLERRDPADLAAVMADLHRLAHRVVWIHPRAGVPGWQPATRGMRAVVPQVDDLLPGGTMEELAGIGARLSQGVGRTAHA